MALFGLFSRKTTSDKETHEIHDLGDKTGHAKQFTEMDALEHLIKFKEFNSQGLKLGHQKLTAATLQGLKEFLSKERIDVLEQPMDDTSRNMLIMELYRIKERTKKSAFSPGLHLLLSGRFRPLQKGKDRLTLKDIMLHCVEMGLMTKPNAA